jgi:C1A family cysteine protease
MWLLILFAFFTGINSTYCYKQLRGVYSINNIGSVYSYSYNDTHWNEFTKFKETFNKTYSNFKELKNRFEIFKDNFMGILKHNLDVSQTFTMGVNQFTDLTPEEFKKIYVTGTRTYKELELGSYSCSTFSSNDSNTPLSVDWRTGGAVTSVKDQGQCGSCWTFSSTGAIEGAWAISKGKLLNLSEQELVDCATGFLYGSHGCNGGQMEGAFKYVIENGQCSLSSYPYVSGQTKTEGTCQKCSTVVTLSSCFDVKQNDQISLKAAVAKQPVSIAIEADTRYFQSYSSGILTAKDCGTNLDHGVLIVGYGTEKGQDYWLIKNSWSNTWGDNGYVKIARSSSTNDPGVCGLAMNPSFPVV